MKPKESDPVASIVIVSYEEIPYLKKCLASLAAHTRIPHEVTVINNSQRNGKEFSRGLRAFPRVRGIQNEANRFYAGGVNQGIREARGRYVVVLNPDAVVTEGWLEGLIRCAERNRKAGLVVPCTNEAVGLQKVRADESASLKTLAPFARRWRRRYAGRTVELHRAIGFCMLLPRGVIARVGLWDESFLAGGYEDYDYCLRVRRSGCRILLCKEVFVYHFGGRSNRKVSRYADLLARNRDLFIRKWCANILSAWDDLDGVFSGNSESFGST